MKRVFILFFCLTIAFGAVPKDRVNICDLINCEVTLGPPTKAPPTKAPSPPPAVAPSLKNYGLIVAELV